MKYDHLKFLIERFDHYYDSINNKGVFYITLNIFLFGGICITYTTYQASITNSTWYCLLAMLICCFGSMLFTIRALRPYMKDNHVNDSLNSLVFYGGIAKHTANLYLEKFDRETEDTIVVDMQRQVHCLAIGLHTKFKRLKYASYLLTVQFCLMFPLFFLITKII